MEAAVPIPAHVASQKRPFNEDAEPSTPNRAITSTNSTPLSILSVDTPSPLKKASLSAGLGSGNDALAPAQTTPASSNAQQPAKRRKLTAQEKEDQRLEKEAKAKALAEKKEQKEAEDNLKAQQKEDRKRAKELKAQQNEEEKRKKDDEKRKKEEEKLKKERSQMKLNAFFTKPKPVPDKSAKAMVDKVQNPATGPISLPPQSTFTCSNAAPPSPQKAMQSNAKSDYDRFFLPFSAPPHTIIAPYNAFMDDPEKLAASYGRMEKLLGQEAVEMEPITLETFRSIFPKRRRGLDTPTIGEIIDLVNESADNPIDLTGEEDLKQQKPLEMLKQIPMKYLRFDEDVRPPYYGTYTKPHRLSEEGKLARNPFSRGLDDLNYDYDSEAEWEEPEEGEDLDSEGEEDLDEDGDEDMDGFLDDDEDPDIKRRLLNGDQEPVSTGLCWENEDRVSILNDGSGAICTDFRDFKMGFLLEPQPRSIDPFSTSYWAPEPIPVLVSNQPTSKNPAKNGFMNPPRLPLTSRPINGLISTANSTQNLPIGAGPKAVKPKRTIPNDQLPAFKAEVEGQDHTKIGMIEVLKKKFPEFPKDAITNTLTMVAKRVGGSEKDKRWVLIP